MSSISASLPPVFTQVSPTSLPSTATPSALSQTPAATAPVTAAPVTPAPQATAATVLESQTFHNTDGTYGPKHQLHKPGFAAPANPLSVSTTA